MNIKKLFAALAGVSLFAQTVVPSAGVFGATYSEELQGAYDWAYSKGVTTQSPIDNANMYGAITRAEMAKMLSVYAVEVLGYEADTSKACNFTDIDSVKGDLHDYIIKSCQLGLMGQGITAFRPYDTISRAEFGTALSRTLWGNKYEGGTPYYANHLNALKAAGIMNQIANAESTKEIRGYVMLMLQRSEGSDAGVDCDDEMVVLACQLGTDACPAACKDDSKENTDGKVKSGDLAVEADAAANRKILKTWTSDLDTLTFKTSEEVEISKITLERYGYSESDQITGIWLEDQDGNVIAESKTLTKDKVTLNLKKDYRKVDGEFEATVVVTTSGAAGTIGFKVTDVESTAKNLNLDDYNPYTYEVVEYKGSEVAIELKGSNKTYNYEEGESYEVARVKVSAWDAAVLVKGMTLTNDGKVDMKESLDELTVKVDSKEVKAKASVNKDDELVITFNEDVEIDINKKATFILEASFKDFDDYGESVKYYIADTADFNAIEKKNGTRVTLNLDKAGKGSVTTYQFNGGKIKLTNKKLGSVDAAQASEGTVIAEWDITITEPISKLSFVISGNNQFVDKLTMVINGDEYDGTRTLANEVKWIWTGDKYGCYTGGAFSGTIDDESACSTAAWTWKAETYKCTAGKYTTEEKCKKANASADVIFTFNNVSIEKSGKIQFKIDIADNENAAGTFTLGPTFNGAVISGAKYDNVSKQYVKAGDVAGSISFSKVTIQPAKAALENKLSKDAEFIKGETARKTVFEGTYTARKSDIDLNKFAIAGTENALGASNTVTFYLFIDGEEVADTDVLNQDESFSDVRVKAGESVKVKVEAEVEAYGADHPTAVTYTLELKGTDTNGNEDTGRGSDDTIGIKIKGKGGVTVEKTASKDTINLKKANSEIAVFNISPSNGNEDVLIEDLVITVEELTAEGTHSWYVAWDAIRVKVDWVEQYDYSTTWTNSILYDVNETIEGKVEVSIALKKDLAGKYKVTVNKINENTTERIYQKYFVPAVVVITKQEDLDGTTKFTYDVTDKSDSDYTVSDFCIYDTGSITIGTTSTLWCKEGDIEGDNMYFEVKWSTGGVVFVKGASYVVNKGAADQKQVIVDYTNYKDYFSINGADARVYKVKN